MIQWQWQTLDDMTSKQLHAVLQLRQAVFVVEQNCAYPDIDDLDLTAFHLSVWQPETAIPAVLKACLRILVDCPSSGIVSIGRVVTHSRYRRQGLGSQLMNQAIHRIELHWPDHRLQLSAQQHLELFYQSFGFRCASDMYLEDGIPHIKMIR